MKQSINKARDFIPTKQISLNSCTNKTGPSTTDRQPLLYQNLHTTQNLFLFKFQTYRTIILRE